MIMEQIHIFILREKKNLLKAQTMLCTLSGLSSSPSAASSAVVVVVVCSLLYYVVVINGQEP